ncbi:MULTISPECIES: hypothetical protein [Microbispora]|nr:MULTISPECIES: hypothetical protein [Microbispora]
MFIAYRAMESEALSGFAGGTSSPKQIKPLIAALVAIADAITRAR